MRRVISYALTAAILCCFSACSGSKNDLSKSSSAEETLKIINDNNAIYIRSELKQPEEIGSIRDIKYDPKYDGIIIFGDSGVCFTDSTFGVYKTFSFDGDATDNVSFEYSEDMIFIARSAVDHENNSVKHCISAYQNDGTLLSDAEIIFDDDIELNTISSVQHIGENRLLICDSEKCFKVDTSGKIIGELKSDESINDIIRLDDGKITGILFSKDKTVLREIDPDTLEFGEFKLNIPKNLSGTIKAGIDDNIICIQENNAIYGLKSANTVHLLIDLTSSGILDLKCITLISDNNFIAAENGKLIMLSERDMGEIAEMQELTLAVAGNHDSIDGLIANFNSQSNNYRIKLNDYSANYEYSSDGINSAEKDLELDIVSGKIPDMVWLEPNEAEKLSSKGAFADLYKFMETDKTYSKDAFLPNYLQACEQDGHLYSIQPDFMIYTIAAKKSHIDKRHWSIREFLEYYRSMPENMELFQQGNNRVAVLNFITADGMNYVNYSDLTCDFDSEEYKHMLEFAKQFPSVEECDFEKKSCRNDTALLEPLYIQNFRDLNLKKYEIFGEDMAFVGTPSDSGKGSSIILGDQFSIMENSPNKEGCWEFIRTTFDNTDNGIPILKSKFESAKKSAQERPYCINENGEKEYFDESAYDWDSNADITVDPMTADDAEYYSDFVTGITRASSVRSETIVKNIISEETASYFAGEITVEICAERIQNRVGLYLSEKY